MDSWWEVDTLEIRNIWYAFLTLLRNESICFFSHVPPPPRIATERTLEKHVLLESRWSVVQGGEGFSSLPHTGSSVGLRHPGSGTEELAGPFRFLL